VKARRNRCRQIFDVSPTPVDATSSKKHALVACSRNPETGRSLPSAAPGPPNPSRRVCPGPRLAGPVLPAPAVGDSARTILRLSVSNLKPASPPRRPELRIASVFRKRGKKTSTHRRPRCAGLSIGCSRVLITAERWSRHGSRRPLRRTRSARLRSLDSSTAPPRGRFTRLRDSRSLNDGKPMEPPSPSRADSPADELLPDSEEARHRTACAPSAVRVRGCHQAALRSSSISDSQISSN